jgi:hypothetical protein
MSFPRYGVILFFIFFAMVAILPTQLLAQSYTLTIDGPALAWNITPPVTKFDKAVVWVNVTSTYPVQNVTLYYAPVQEDRSPPGDTSEFTPKIMNSTRDPKLNSTYSASIPTVDNHTWVWGFANVFDQQGHHNQTKPMKIYYSYTPNPAESSVRLDFNLEHLDPKTLQMNLTVSGTARNTWTFNGITITSEFWEIPIAKPQFSKTDKFSFTNSISSVTLGYRSGSPELYPFDNYTFSFTLQLPYWLNGSQITIDGVTLGPQNATYYDKIPILFEGIPNALDNSAWVVHSVMMFTPALMGTGYSAYLSALTITFFVTRAEEQVNYLLIFPALSLYVMLGASILLKGKEELRNRLLVYINVFIFSYGFESVYIKNLRITPVLLEFSIIERVVLALIPCTVILFLFSIPGSKPVWRRILDFAGGGTAAVTLFSISRVQPYFPWNRSVTVSLLDVGPIGWAFFGALLMPLIIDTLYSAVRYRSNLTKDRQDTDRSNNANSTTLKIKYWMWIVAILAASELILKLISKKQKDKDTL